MNKRMNILIFMFLSAFLATGCVNRKLLRQVNTQGEENLKNLNINIQIIQETFIPVMSAYLDLKIQQLKVKKQNELLSGGTKLSPESQIQLEFFVRDQNDKKKEVLQLLQELLSTIKNQSEIATIHLDAYKNFTEAGKLTTSITEQLQDSGLHLKALALLKMDPTKANKIQDLLSEFKF